jgi:peptidoglycan hydrolase CwlO-like protein
MKNKLIVVGIVLVIIALFFLYLIKEKEPVNNNDQIEKLNSSIEQKEQKKKEILSDLDSVSNEIVISEKKHEKIKSIPNPVYLLTGSVYQLDSFWSTYKSPDFTRRYN